MNTHLGRILVIKDQWQEEHYYWFTYDQIINAEAVLNKTCASAWSIDPLEVGYLNEINLDEIKYLPPDVREIMEEQR